MGIKTTFELSKIDISNDNIELDFLGLDTYSKIYINDYLLLETDNMFRNYTVDVKTLVIKNGRYM